MKNTAGLKVFWVLAWDQYYPGSGLTNVHDTFELEEDANKCRDSLEGSFDYVIVVDIRDKLL